MSEALFDLPEYAQPAVKTKTRRWGGAASKAARDHCRQMLPAPCGKCGNLIPEDAPEASWQAGHIEDHATGGADHWTNYRPEHTKCNLSAGGRLGARITNGHKAEQDWTRERTKRWW